MGGLTRREGLKLSLRAAGRMLSLAKAKENLILRGNPFPPLGYLLVNIFLCAFAERYILDDAGGVYLPLFLVVQWMAGLIITLSFTGGTGAEILRNTAHFPGSAQAGYYFLLAGSLRRPEFYLFASAGCVFTGTVLGGSLPASAGIAALSAVPAIVLQVIASAAAAKMIRAARPVDGLVILTAAAAVATVASVVVFGASALASSFPMAGWTAMGIRAFSEGHAAGGLTVLLALAFLAAVAHASFGGLLRR